MIKQYSTTIVLLALTLTACVNSRAPTPPTTSATPNPNQTTNQTTRLNATNQCPPGVTVKVDGKATPVTVPNLIGRLENPSMEIVNDRLSMGVITEDMGLFELTDFDAKKLKTGTYGGEHFRLMLFNLPDSSDSECANTNYKPESKLTITEYNADSGQMAGCFYGKFDCGGKLIEVNATVSGKLF